MINDLVKSKNKNIIPVWFLRQAGRHINEYYKIRDKHKSFMDFCLNKNSVIEATILPTKYYDIDAAILFSDILILPYCMGQDVTFKKGYGPLLGKLNLNKSFFNQEINLNKLNPIRDAIKEIRSKLCKKKDLIGFCGAPWTTACYMIEKMTSRDFTNTRKFLWDNTKDFEKLINKLTKECVNLLEFQYNSGVNVLMIFDTWSQMIPDIFWKKFGIEPIKIIVSNLRRRGVLCPIIGLPFKSGEMLIDYSYEANVDIVSIDWKTSLKWALKNINKDVITQGNLDPIILTTNNFSNIKKEVNRILNLTRDNLHIFNVGHGLTPETNIDDVRYVISLIRDD